MTRQKWEYDKRFLVEWDTIIEYLNGLGERGWELVHVEGGWIYLKRPIEEKEASEGAA